MIEHEEPDVRGARAYDELVAGDELVQMAERALADAEAAYRAD